MFQKSWAHILIALLALQGCYSGAGDNDGVIVQDPANEVIYHVLPRSFYDSNGDQVGDLNGLREKLDYLQELGVTSILMLPLYNSVYYHNYFTDDFRKIDPEYGTMEDYLNLVKEVHRRGMKIYMDMEIQYVTEDHPWYKDSYRNPASPYSDYILYNGPGNTKPEPIIFNIVNLEGYNGAIRKAVTVNLYSKGVQAYDYALFRYWVDPDNDGKFDDGVDGFRIDHMMDDLDFKGKLTGLFAKFWKPLLTKLQQVNPALKDVAEQAVWGSFGIDYLKNAGVDRVFAFRLQAAIASFNKAAIMQMADSTFSMTPPGKQQIVFVANHDMTRFSTLVDRGRGKMEVGGALNLLIGGIPSIYYGQELGMTGRKSMGGYGFTDANDIPQREAFEWYKADTGRGMALWYKDSGPWWDSTNLKAGDGISLEEEKNDPHSLWNFYRNMIRLRRTHVALVRGTYKALKNNNDAVFSFLRDAKDTAAVVAVNLSAIPQPAALDFSGTGWQPAADRLQPLYGKTTVRDSAEMLTFSLPPYGIQVWRIRK